MSFLCNYDVSDPDGIAIDSSYIYAASDDTGHINRYDIATGTLNETGFLCETGVFYSLRGIAVDDDFIYVIDDDSLVVLRFNKSDGTPNTSGFSCALESGSKIIGIDGSYIYVITWHGSCHRYVTATGSVDLGFSGVTGDACGAMVFDSTYFYVTNAVSM